MLKIFTIENWATIVINAFINPSVELIVGMIRSTRVDDRISGDQIKFYFTIFAHEVYRFSPGINEPSS